MRWRLCELAFAVLLGGASPALAQPPAPAEHNILSDTQQQAGWKLLFDGETTAGWRNYRSETIGAGWQVRDGVLLRAGDEAGDIVTTEAFDNFEIILEYRISPAGNSGLMFHVTEDSDAAWHSGPEVQIQDNLAGSDPHKSGWLYDLYRPEIDPATGEPFDPSLPAGEWNELHVRICAATSEVRLNGQRTAQFTLGSDDWRQRVADSKFAEFPQFGQAGNGVICLQDHGDEVAFRNIRIRRLTPAGTPLDADETPPSPQVSPQNPVAPPTGMRRIGGTQSLSSADSQVPKPGPRGMM